MGKRKQQLSGWRNLEYKVLCAKQKLSDILKMKETCQLFERGKKIRYFLKSISLPEIPYSEPCLSMCVCMPYMHYACVCQKPWKPWQLTAGPKALLDSLAKRKPASRGYQSSLIMFPSRCCIIQLNMPDGMQEIDTSLAFSCFTGKLKTLLSKHSSGRKHLSFFFCGQPGHKARKIGIVTTKHSHNYFFFVFKNVFLFKPSLLK